MLRQYKHSNSFKKENPISQAGYYCDSVGQGQH